MCVVGRKEHDANAAEVHLPILGVCSSRTFNITSTIDLQLTPQLFPDQHISITAMASPKSLTALKRFSSCDVRPIQLISPAGKYRQAPSPSLTETITSHR
jgi:hypothetical protein